IAESQNFGMKKYLARDFANLFGTPPYTRDLSSLKITSNKRPLNNKEIQQYTNDISVMCAFNMTPSELSVEVGGELANELFSIRDTNPEVWTSDLEKYIDNVLNNNGNQYEIAVQKFQMNPFIYTVRRYFLTFIFSDRGPLCYARSAEITKSGTNSGIVKVDSKVMRQKFFKWMYSIWLMCCESILIVILSLQLKLKYFASRMALYSLNMLPGTFQQNLLLPLFLLVFPVGVNIRVFSE
ncbi:8109_t:CDS:2, partial [Acaulospora morrowiae]